MDSAQDKIIPIDPLNLDKTVEVVLRRDSVVKQIAIVADRLKPEGQDEAAGQDKGPRRKKIAAQLVRKDLIRRQRPVYLELSGVIGLTIAQTQRPPLLGRDIGRQRQIAAWIDCDEIGLDDPVSQLVGDPVIRPQEPRRTVKARIRHAQPRNVEDRHSEKTQLRALEVHLLFKLVMDHALRPDFPDRNRIRRTDLTRGRHRASQFGVAPAHALHLGGCHLQLLRQHKPRAGQDTVLHIGRKLCLIGKDAGAASIRQHDRTFDGQGVIRRVKGDACRRQRHALLQNFHRTFCNQNVVAPDLDPVGNQSGGILRPKGAGADGQRHSPEQMAHQPSSRCSKSPSANRTDATGALHAAMDIGICPLAPRTCAKFLRKKIPKPARTAPITIIPVFPKRT